MSSDLAPLVAVGLIVALICAVASAAIAQQKGLNPAGYMLAGLFLGVIGLIVAAAAQPASARVAAPSSPPGWHPDPWGQAPLRWWDGVQWTQHTGDGGTA